MIRAVFISLYKDTKISKRLASSLILLLILIQCVYSQGIYDNLTVIYQDTRKEVVLLNGSDSLAIVMLSGIEAKYNHLKNKKSKTVYYPLATYSNPTEIVEVPVKVGKLLHLQGVLQGDTATRFDCIFSIAASSIKVEMKTRDLSTNEFSFSIRLFPRAQINWDELTYVGNTYVKYRKKFIRITVRDKEPQFVFYFKNPSPTPY